MPGNPKSGLERDKKEQILHAQGADWRKERET